VGGVTAEGVKTAFSSIGPTYDGRIKPDVMSFAYDVTIASPSNNFYEGNGTSFAAPSLAGMMACFWQARSDASESEIREIIKQSADNYSTPNGEYGYGIPDFKKALDMMNLENCDIFDKKSLFTLVPNPSNGMVKMQFNYEGNVSVEVFDVMGNNVYSFDNHTDDVIAINNFLSNLEAGVYFVKVMGENISQTSKVVKY
jgi:hypothetical protein